MQYLVLEAQASYQGVQVVRHAYIERAEKRVPSQVVSNFFMFEAGILSLAVLVADRNALSRTAILSVTLTVVL